jgi:NAD(P)H dehydrogenase (quinone)
MSKPMKCLVVIAHPLQQSLCHTLAQKTIDLLQTANHEVVREDLYAEQFEGALDADERSSYYAPTYNAQAVAAQKDRLMQADALVLCFPTWWFGFPAVLKGWFDRVWGPGIAFDHAADLGAIQARLQRLRHVMVITSLGSPWWVDRLLMRQPVRRILKTAILGTCAPQAKMRMLSIYRSEHLTPARFMQIEKQLEAQLKQGLLK